MKKFIGDNGGGTPNLGESKDNVFFKNEEKAKLQANERKKYFQRADKTVFSGGGEELTSREYEEDKAFKESDESMSSRESGLPSSSAQSEEMPIHCLTVIGQVEGHFLLSDQTKTTKYEHVLPALVAIEESPKIKGLLILLNTVGGDVEAGLAIAEMIAGMDTPTVSLVFGRRTFDRGSSGGFRRLFFYRPVGHDDDSSRANERSCGRSTSDVFIF